MDDMKRLWAMLIPALITLGIFAVDSSGLASPSLTVSGPNIGGISGDLSCTSAGNCTVGAISGSTPISVAPATIQWAAGVSSPTITQASESTAIKGADLSMTPQQSTHATDQGGGNLVATFQAPTGAGVEAALQLKRSANVLSEGWATSLPITGSAGWQLSSSQSAAVTSSGNLVLNSSGTTYVNGNTDVRFLVNGSYVAGFFNGGLGGAGSTPFAWKGETSPNTVACSTGGTQTISAAQSLLPFFLVTTGTLTSNCVVDFGTNAVTGYYTIDVSGVGTLGAFSLGFKNGSTTKTISATQLTNLIATGASAIIVATYGTNNITIL